MPVALLDVNVLFALAWTDHIHHEAAHRWFDEQKRQGWATCPTTQCGFVRISANPKVSPVPTTPAMAMDMLGEMMRYPGHIFWPDSIPLFDVLGPGKLKITGHLQVTDSYLVGLSIKNGGRFATFDRRATSLAVGPAAGTIEVISG